jgi:hypothetical protein
MLELLNQLDGFDTRGDVKVIMATNRVRPLSPCIQISLISRLKPLTQHLSDLDV